jgi:N-acetylglucosamine-6-phosphate deacetylase
VALALVNCQIYTGADVFRDRALIVDRGDIVDIVSRDRVPEGPEIVDLKRNLVAPAFVDVQVNGGGGVLFNEDTTVEGIGVMADAHAAFGTLSLLPTLITASVEKMMAAVDAVRAAIERGMTSVLGLHLEGPYIDASAKGVHDERFVRPLTDEELRSVLLPASDVLRVLTISPRMVSPEQTERLVDAGIIVLLGHTDATYEEAVACFERGASGVTHLFNAMSQMDGAKPGTVGAALATRDAWAGIIGDSYHVHPGSMVCAKRAKGDRLMLVSDAMPPLGLPDCGFALGPYEITCVDGRCTTPDGVLAGSAIDMASAVRTCVERCGFEPDEALRMASTYPAAFLGAAHIGTIAPGMRADLVILDAQLNVHGVVRRGVVRLW